MIEPRDKAFRTVGQGIRLAMRLTPKASCDEILGLAEGPDGPVIKAKVRAIPDKSKANQALLKLVAKWVQLPQSEINLVSGHKSRFKTIEIVGEPEILRARICALLEAKSE